MDLEGQKSSGEIFNCGVFFVPVEGGGHVGRPCVARFFSVSAGKSSRMKYIPLPDYLICSLSSICPFAIGHPA